MAFALPAVLPRVAPCNGNSATNMCAQKPKSPKRTPKSKAAPRKRKPTKKEEAARLAKRQAWIDSWVTLKKPEELTFGARPRRSGSGVLRNLPNTDVDLPLDVLATIRSYLRYRSLVTKVAEMAQVRSVRSTGLVYLRQPISDDCPDGLPDFLRDLQTHDTDLLVVNVPPALVQRACGDGYTKQLVALYEILGSTKEELEQSKQNARERDIDIEKQLRAWSDRGESLRTETDMMHPEGPELFREPFLDYWE